MTISAILSMVKTNWQPLPEPPEKVYCEKCVHKLFMYLPSFEKFGFDMCRKHSDPLAMAQCEFLNKNNDCKDYVGKNDVPY